MVSFGFLCTSLWVAGKVTMIGDPLSVSDRWLEENFGANNAAWKDVFAMFFHSRCGFSDCVNSFEEIHIGRLEIGVVLSVSGREWMWLWTFSEFVWWIRFSWGWQSVLADNNSGVIAISAGVFYNSFFLYICSWCVFIYRWVYSFIYIFDDGMWQMVLFQKGVWKFSPIPDVILLRWEHLRISGNLYLTKVRRLWLMSGAQHFYWIWYGFVVHGWRTTDFTCFCKDF